VKRFHDYRLVAYSVRSFGNEIVLHLVHDYPPEPKTESHIKFSDVAAYHFIHTGGAIITDIEQVPLAQILEKVGDKLTRWWQQHGGYIHWDDDRSKYEAVLEEQGYKAWFLASAVGFEGFVIARAAEEVPS